MAENRNKKIGKNKAETKKTENKKIEKNKTETKKTENKKIEKNKAEKKKTENKKIEKNKTVQNYRQHRNNKNNSLFIGIEIGAILLVLAEICCILAGIYNMLSRSGSIAVIITSALLLLGVTGVFLYILRDTLLEKMVEQKQTYEKLLQMNKMAYGKMEERDEKLYKRQLSVAKAQIKRTRESVMNMVRANEYIIDVIEEKLGDDSVLSSYGVALSEVQESVAQLRELCEKIAGGQTMPVPDSLPEQEEMVPEPEEEMPEQEKIVPEAEEELPELTEMLPEAEEELPELTEMLPEAEEELPELTEILPEREKPVSVEIEPLPEEVLKNIGEPEMEAMLDELVPEAEVELGEFLPEIEIPEEEEALPEIEIPELEETLPEIEEPDEEAPSEEDTDTGQPMSMEDIAALFNNL